MGSNPPKLQTVTRISTLILALLLCATAIHAQDLDKTLNKDSLLKVVLKNMPKEKKAIFLKEYNDANDQSKEFLLVMFSMPRSSKKELIKNIDSNYARIYHLKTEYAKLVPANYEVDIEFNPEDKLLNMGKTVDISITHTVNGKRHTYQDWNLPHNSNKLNEMLKMIGWNEKTLEIISKLLTDAHCVSIANGEPTLIGFARSGMGKYFYKLFDKNLTTDQVKQYTNGCTDIFYKKNIILEYGGGAIGPQCFPD